MEGKVLFSIIVPIYGVDKYLNKCVKSLINQTYKNIEIILVDDGSKDNCPGICDYYSALDNRIKVIHKRNGGLVSARKAGAEIASGQYIICVDGDDWVSTKYVEHFNSAIMQYKPDVICCGYIQTNEIIEINQSFKIESGYYNLKKMEQYIYPIAIESEFGEIFPPQLWAKAFKKELYLPEQLAVSDLIRIGEDGAVVKPILTKATSLYIIDKCLYYYRANNESMTKNNSVYDWNGPRYIYDHLKKRINFASYNFENQIIRRTARDIYTVVFSQFNSKSKYNIIKKVIKEQLQSSDFKKILLTCKYKRVKYKLEIFLLRHSLVLPIYFFHKQITKNIN